MKKCFLLALIAMMGFSSNAFAYLEDFNDGLAQGWTPDESSGWILEEGAYKGNAGENGYWRNSVMQNYNLTTPSTIKTSFKKDYYGGEGQVGVVFGGSFNKTNPSNRLYAGGIYYLQTGTPDTWQWVVGIQEYFWNSGMNQWRPTSAWNSTTIPVLTAGQWYDMTIDVTSTSATVDVLGHEATLALAAGIPQGDVGVYHSVGWTNFDDFEVTAVPEPTSMLLLGSGLVGLFSLRKKTKK
ncbi:MAG: PEP-CTERM sorting domain-containing protein [Candidatus Omnitrophota bacterium]